MQQGIPLTHNAKGVDAISEAMAVALESCEGHTSAMKQPTKEPCAVPLPKTASARMKQSKAIKQSVTVIGHQYQRTSDHLSNAPYSIALGPRSPLSTEAPEVDTFWPLAARNPASPWGPENPRYYEAAPEWLEQ